MDSLRSWWFLGACLVAFGASPGHADEAVPPAADAVDATPDASPSADENDPDYDPRVMRTDDLDDEIARGRFATGQSLYEAGRYIESAQEFESAYALSPRSSLLFNAYLAWRDAGRLGDAVRTLGSYLENTPDAADHVQLSNRLRAMREQLTADRAREDAESAAAEAERQRLQSQAEAERARAEEQRQRALEAGSAPHPVGYVVGGVGVAMLLGGGILAFIAHDRATTIEGACPNRTCPTNYPLDSELSSARRMQRATDSLVLGSVGVIATGVILILTVNKAPDEAEGATVEPVAGCTGTGCSLGLRGAF